MTTTHHTASEQILLVKGLYSYYEETVEYLLLREAMGVILEHVGLN